MEGLQEITFTENHLDFIWKLTINYNILYDKDERTNYYSDYFKRRVLEHLVKIIMSGEIGRTSNIKCGKLLHFDPCPYDYVISLCRKNIIFYYINNIIRFAYLDCETTHYKGKDIKYKIVYTFSSSYY